MMFSFGSRVYYFAHCILVGVIVNYGGLVLDVCIHGGLCLLCALGIVELVDEPESDSD
jgi:hypothetical protein